MNSTSVDACATWLSGNLVTRPLDTMTSRPNIQTFLNHTIQIRHEIMRFQSVHPNIYAIYELLEELPESVAQKIRDHVVCIEGKKRHFFHNSMNFRGNIWVTDNNNNAKYLIQSPNKLSSFKFVFFWVGFLVLWTSHIRPLELVAGGHEPWPP